MLELSTQFLDGDDETITVILSADEITLEPIRGGRIWLSRQVFERIGQLIQSYDRALAALKTG